ncbi:recombinase family protein [Facklamia sp. P12955]|uniref:recombinase family protein n=1 Tax=Facklamia sp. P12955 TaxID=3421946 RepID=UPI003D1722D5
MKKACMYLRLSRDDGDSMESNSISNQRQIIQTFAKTKELDLVCEYIDDGYTGSNFDRPDFKKMINDLDRGRFSTIIVKDLSRFGRDYIETGKYLQKIFPEKGVRFISVNDSYDSEEADMSDTHLILPIKNFINDSYCRDISMKVKSAKDIKRKKGDFIGAFAPFGYKKSLENKHQLVVDEEVAYIIKRIFNMKIEGYSSKSIAGFLNRIGATTPAKHKSNKGKRHSPGFMAKEAKWSANMINRIIENKVYLGILEQGKTLKLNYKSKKEIDVHEKDWIVIEDTHEAIITKSIYHLANKMLMRDLKTCKDKPSLYSGLLYCADCGSSMVRRKVKSKSGTTIYYICSNYNRTGECSRHSIKEEDIVKHTKSSLTNYIKKYEEILEKISKLDISDITINADFKSLEREKDKYERLRQSLYMDLEDELITTNEFERYRKNYLTKIKTIEKQIIAKKELVHELEEQLKNKDTFLSNVIPDSDMKELTRTLLITFIDQVQILEDGKVHFVYNNVEMMNLLEKLSEKEKEEIPLKGKTLSIHRGISKLAPSLITREVAYYG